MPAIDVLAAAVHRLFPTFVDQASAAHPMLDHLFGPENMEDMNTGAPYWEASFRVQGPGAATHIVNGNEIMPGQKDDITLRARVDPARVIYNYDLPEKDYAEAQWNPDKAVNLVEEYDKAAIDEIFDALDYQLQTCFPATGTATGWTAAKSAALRPMRAFGTLNGDQTGLPTTGLQNGLMQFALPVAQTGTIHGVTRTTTAIFTQYPAGGLIPSYSAEGEKYLYEVQHAIYAREPGPVVGLCDMGSFNIITAGMGGDRRYVYSRTGKIDGDEKTDGLKGLVFGRLFPSIWLRDDAGTFTTAPSLGVCYWIGMKNWRARMWKAHEGQEMVTPHGAKKKLRIGRKGPIDIGRQDVCEYRNILNMAWMHTRPNACGVVAGIKN